MSHAAPAMQSTDQVLMIRPVRFQSNPDTAASNTFQCEAMAPEQAQAAALREFDGYAAALRSAAVGVTVLDDCPQVHTPDSIFPNNWISCDRAGRVYLYPMAAPNRRLERRMSVLAELDKQFQIGRLVDLGHFGERDAYLEGTGSMVLDHAQRIAYVCHSPRSHPAPLNAYLAVSGYRAFWFHAHDRGGVPIYHTNVMMCVGSTLALVCLDALPDPEQRRALAQSLQAGGKEIVDLSLDQLEQFSGNMLELRSVHGEPLFAASTRAWAALAPAQQQRITACARPVLAPLDTIERLGGGGARCMLAEIFLPKKVLVPAD